MDKDLEEKETWNALRSRLNNSYDYNEHWEKAIVLFDKRLRKKFFTPVQTIIKHQQLEGEGFAIVTVLCALVESLASFRKGQIYSLNLKGLPSYYYSRSGRMFEEFLHTDVVFKDNFWSQDATGKHQDDDPFSAYDFYTNVRCGLLHEARTKGQWHINATTKDVKKETVFLERRGSKIVILRTVMFHRIQKCVSNYLHDLRNENKQFNALRRYLARKLDHIYGYDHTAKGFDWWKDK